MESIQTNLVDIAILAEEREDENDRFRDFLQRQDASRIDSLVHALNESIAPQIDCTQCGNCCKTLMVSITPEERPFFAAHFNLPPAEAAAQYLTESMEGNTIMCQQPCVFLQDNRCTVYSQRFTDCRNFPHLHQPGFVRRMFSMVMHYGTCPIIFNVMEALKKEVWNDE
jgi:uncharacterized protein